MEFVNRIKDVVLDIKDGNARNVLTHQKLNRLIDRVVVFEHCTLPDHEFTMAGSYSSREFLVASHGESHVYLVTGLTRVFFPDEVCTWPSGHRGGIRELVGDTNMKNGNT
ncbi:MAG: hypothetical protein PHG06_16315 [Parabacteroides sp.]|nr:hypothetical protein [Parabacteroides sp.]